MFSVIACFVKLFHLTITFGKAHIEGHIIGLSVNLDVLSLHQANDLLYVGNLPQDNKTFYQSTKHQKKSQNISGIGNCE